MRLIGNFQIPAIDVAKFKSALHKTLSEALTVGTKAYLETVVPLVSTEGVPVWSGASRATFARLASYVEYAINWTPVPKAPDRISLGLDTGTATFDTGQTKEGVYTFTYLTDLPHLIVNEYHDATQWGFHLTHPGPYRFQEKGKDAFEAATSDIELPSWESFLDTRQMNVG